MSARRLGVLTSALIASALVAGLGCGKGGASNGAAATNSAAATASAGENLATPAASSATLPAPKAGPASWQASYAAAVGERPKKVEPAPVKAPTLACATSVSAEFLREKHKDAYAALLAEQAKGEPQRVADWAARYRPWYIARAPLVGAIAEGCSVSGTDAFAKGCSPFKEPWGRLETTKPFTCRALASLARTTNGAPVDTLVCAVDDFRGLVLIDVPKAARATVLGDSLRTQVDSEGMASALGVRALTIGDAGLGRSAAPALVEVRTVSSVRRHSRAEGFLDQTTRTVQELGVSRELVGALLAHGNVWSVGLPTEGGAVLQLTKRGDSSLPLPPVKPESVAVPCEEIKARWDRAFCELQRMPPWATQDLESPMAISTAPLATAVRTSDAAPGDGWAYRGAIERTIGAEIWRKRVIALGGFEALSCTLADVTRSPRSGVSPLRTEMAARAGVTASQLYQHLFVCRGDERTTTGTVIVRVPSHRITAHGGFDAERSQRGVVRIDSYTADATSLFGPTLAKFVTSTPPFLDLPRDAKLEVTGYSKIWRSRGEWTIAFEPKCPDEGFGCTQNDGLEPRVELTTQPACDVSGFKYP